MGGWSAYLAGQSVGVAKQSVDIAERALNTQDRDSARQQEAADADLAADASKVTVKQTPTAVTVKNGSRHQITDVRLHFRARDLLIPIGDLGGCEGVVVKVAGGEYLHLLWKDMRGTRWDRDASSSTSAHAQGAEVPAPELPPGVIINPRLAVSTCS